MYAYVREQVRSDRVARSWASDRIRDSKGVVGPYRDPVSRQNGDNLLPRSFMWGGIAGGFVTEGLASFASKLCCNARKGLQTT